MNLLEQFKAGKIAGPQIKEALGIYLVADVREALKIGFRDLACSARMDGCLYLDDSTSLDKKFDEYNQFAEKLNLNEELVYEGVVIPRK